MKKSIIVKNKKNRERKKQDLKKCVAWCDYYFGNNQKRILPF